MICLKIENGKGYFLATDGIMHEIHEIRKEDILRLLDLATDPDTEFEMDEIKNGNIQNEAHRLIYGGIYRKFKELLDNKDRFIDESNGLYKDAIQKYQEN